MAADPQEKPRPHDPAELIEGEVIEASVPVPVPGPAASEGRRGGRGAKAVDAAFDVGERVVAPVVRLGWRGASGVGRRLGINRTVGQAVDRGVDRALESDAAERAADRVLGSPAAQSVWGKFLESQEIQQMIERVTAAPELRTAIASQGVGLIEDARQSARELGRRLDDAADRGARRVLRREQRTIRPLVAGAGTRLLAILLDLAILNLILLLLSTLAAAFIDIVFNFSGDNQGVTIALGGFAWLAATALYLGLFWTLAERTPGMGVFGLRIKAADGAPVPPRQDLRRLVGFYLAAIPFFLGFKGILFRDDRRGFHDRFARTVVVYADPEIDRGVKDEGSVRQVRQRTQAAQGQPPKGPAGRPGVP